MNENAAVRGEPRSREDDASSRRSAAPKALRSPASFATIMPLDRADGAERRTPAPIWALAALLAIFGLVSVVGALVFAFPEGGWLGNGVGTFFVVAGLALLVLAWRLRRGERWVWAAALAVIVTHEVVHRAVNLATLGTIPAEDLPFLALTGAILVLLLIPRTRRFFSFAG